MYRNASPLGAFFALLATAVYSLILFALRDSLSTPIVALLYLVPVLFSSSLWGLGAGVVASVGAFLAFNYLFIPPYYTLSVHQTPDLIALIIFLAVGILVSQLVGRMRAAIARVEAREHQVAQLYRFSAVMVGLRREQDVANHVVRGMAHVLNADVVQGIIKKAPAAEADIFIAPEGRTVPDWPPQATAPLITDRGKLGDIRLWREQEPLTESERRLMQTFAEQGALALERALLEQSEARAGLLEESDRMKSALLSSVSHELRTPLVTIKAAVTSLLSGEVKWESAARHELLSALDEETDRLNALVGDLLDMTRIEAGALKLHSQWNVLAEITDAAMGRLSSRMAGRTVEVAISEDLPMVWVDQTLIQQVFVNLLDNSLKYSPPDKPISVQAKKTKDKKLKIEIANHGPSVAAEDLDTIFERFHRVTDADHVPGTGLGLSICKGIIEAHGEKIHAENRKDGFAFIFTLPILHDGKTATAAMRLEQ